MALKLDQQICREIGQHFVFGFHGYDVSEDVERLIREYYVGNIILMKRNVQSFEQVRSLTLKLQQIAKDAGHERPLMIGTDQENGLVSAFSKPEAGTQFPGAMTIAATASSELAEQVAFASGRELRLAGINWTYAPVCDVNSEARNPVIGVRSFGDDPKEVAKYAGAVSRGFTKARVASSLKHFPGHGDTHVDSHLALPVISKSLESLSATELVPFTSLIPDVASIMTGHMALPQLTGTATPASLSRSITTDLLRSNLGYSGVIVTDCLEMAAVAAEYGIDNGAVMALEAGADVVMICHTLERQVGAVEKTYEAVREGRLSVEELKRGGERVRRMKERFAGSWEEVLGSAEVLDSAKEEWRKLNTENTELSQLSHRAYRASTAALSEAPGVLPFKHEELVYVFTPQAESINLAVDDADGVLRDGSGRVRNTAGPSYLAFAQAVSSRAKADHVVYAVSGELPEKLGEAKAVIFATRNANTSRWQLEYLKRLREKVVSVPMVVVSTCGPYDVMGARQEGVDLRDVPVLATFEFTVPALLAAVEVIFGERQTTGRCPVVLGIE
ncbi:glycoside hydrolase family 3 protein [Neolentinus lepideus HHB14362 ss-1]|uniref:Glycoside hydrolase family 3 protein n=1 Tax=Neolentinus lepideus HHB14362 ss-1 TaxID=1314782 RepID=A0A165SBF3_9AGAM|nr:glycoside hydrolase family 3 protein [Neolentinus lepideus HHB14362 ss-1]